MAKKKKTSWNPLDNFKASSSDLGAKKPLKPQVRVDEGVDDVSVSTSISRTLVNVDSFSDSGDSTHHIAELFDSQDTAHQLLDKLPEPGTQTETKRPYASLFKNNREQSAELKIEKIECEEDVFTLEPHDVVQVNDAWGFCLVGYFAGRFPGIKALTNLCDSWGVKYRMHTHANGWLVFQFDNENDRGKVLGGGPYFAYGRPLLLKLLPSGFQFNDEEINVVPVWIKLPGLPLECWHPRAFGKIASKVGVPVSTDKMTFAKKRISYARLLVEVDASKELVRSVKFKLPNGCLVDQKIVYEFEPKYCNDCKYFGHVSGSCPPKPQLGTEGKSIAKKNALPAVEKQAALAQATAKLKGLLLPAEVTASVPNDASSSGLAKASVCTENYQTVPSTPGPIPGPCETENCTTGNVESLPEAEQAAPNTDDTGIPFNTVARKSTKQKTHQPTKSSTAGKDGLVPTTTTTGRTKSRGRETIPPIGLKVRSRTQGGGSKTVS